MRINAIWYFGDFVAAPLAATYLIWRGFAVEGIGVVATLLAALLTGLFVWTLAEYAIHRWLYHRAPWLRDLHTQHHERPAEFIGAPSFLSTALVISLTYAPAAMISATVAGGFASGALLGYCGYMLAHHAAHHWNLQPGHLLYPARVRHMAHHYHDNAHFGIVTGLWDKVLGTEIKRRDGFAGL